MSIALLAGLGNPGREYARTRHNLGFRAVDAWAARAGSTWSHERRFDAEVSRAPRPGGGTIWLAKPLTYMNDSGRSLRALADFHRLEPADVLVVYDEVNVDLGRVKLSIQGTDGGHNGVSSLLTHLGEGFARLRLGIGPKLPRTLDLAAFVLAPFRPEEELRMDSRLPHFLDCIDLVLTLGPAAAMNRINQRSLIHDQPSA